MSFCFVFSDHPNHAVSVDSTEIFPVGWCDSNSYPLKPPLYYQIPSSSSNSVLGDERSVIGATLNVIQI